MPFLQCAADAGVALMLCADASKRDTGATWNNCRKLLAPNRSSCWEDRVRSTCAPVHWRDGLPSCNRLHARPMRRRAAFPMLPGT
jgi:hypothetical protein